MKFVPKALTHITVVLALMAIPLLAKTDKPSEKGPGEPADDFGREIRNLLYVKDLDVPPVIVSGRPPQYPAELRKARTPGYVVVEFIINTSGDVIQIQVRESSRREFEMPALKSVQTWKFKPGMKDKHAANVRMTQRLEFEAPAK